MQKIEITIQVKGETFTFTSKGKAKTFYLNLLPYAREQVTCDLKDLYFWEQEAQKIDARQASELQRAMRIAREVLPMIAGGLEVYDKLESQWYALQSQETTTWFRNTLVKEN